MNSLLFSIFLKKESNKQAILMFCFEIHISHMDNYNAYITY